MGLEMVFFRYFSIIKVEIGAAQSAPYPPSSTITYIAISGFSFGAKARKLECSGFFFPSTFFSEVPVFPQIIRLFIQN